VNERQALAFAELGVLPRACNLIRDLRTVLQHQLHAVVRLHRHFEFLRQAVNHHGDFGPDLFPILVVVAHDTAEHAGVFHVPVEVKRLANGRDSLLTAF
jgi:hypothetical protein